MRKLVIRSGGVLLVIAALAAVGTVAATRASTDTSPAEPQGQAQAREPYEPFLERARALHRQVPLIDGHNDYPFQVRQRTPRDLTKLDITQPQPDIATDIERLKRGGVGGMFWSAYAPISGQQALADPRDGAWYAALKVETSIAEVGFHLTMALADAGDIRAVVDYVEMLASMSGLFVDLRGVPDHPSLDPDPMVGYPAGNALASLARAQGHNGIIYPSVRHPQGTCIAALWPNVVQSVVHGAMYRLTWSGKPDYAWEALG